MELPPGIKSNFYQYNLVSKMGKIVFGDTATSLTQFSYQVLMFVNRPKVTVQCGAAMISDEWIISARHCVLEYYY